MDEKTTMTVEFLRARLLSERIVSKTARQRAEILAQRVIELEEQLRIVNIQRKNAEKATEEVISILETQGISYISGLTDSIIDREVNQCNVQEKNQCIISEDVKENDFLTASKINRSMADNGLLCSNIGCLSSNCNCSSWINSSLDSQEKQNTTQNRQIQSSNFITSVKSPQKFSGKSFHIIKRSASENELLKPALLVAFGNEVAAHLDDFDEKHECPLEVSENTMDKFSVDPSFALCPDGQNAEGKDVGAKIDMERALEHQNKLINKFQAMENAQKEWEQKFKVAEMSTLCNPEREEEEEAETLKFKDISSSENKHADDRCTISERSITASSSNANSHSHDHKLQKFPEARGSSRRQIFRPQAANSGGGGGGGGGLENVLRSLERARISIHRELAKAVDIPNGSSALFRLPSDSRMAVSGSNVYGSSLRLTASRPDLPLIAADGRLQRSRYAEYGFPYSSASSSSGGFLPGGSGNGHGRRYSDSRAPYY